MAVTVTNLIAGPAVVHVAPFGTVEPVDAVAALGVGWRDVGGTSGGVKWTVDRKFMDLNVDQIPRPVGKRVTDISESVSTTLSEATLLNWATVLAELDAAVVTVTTTSTLEPSATDPSAEPNYVAVCITGPAPGGGKRRIIVRRALSTDAITSENQKTEQTGIPVTFSGNYVSPSIKAYKMMDTTS